MGFCTGDCPCGKSCASSDDFCQQHRCREDGCTARSRSGPKVLAGENLNKPIQRVRHADLQRVSTESPFRSWCPVCDQGILLVRREDLPGTRLCKLDNCSMCGQLFLYEENEIGGSKLVPFPTTLDEAVGALGELLGDEDRAFMLKGGLSGDEVATELHHSLGRHLRNTWRLWQDSPLAQHLKTVHKVEHPDDMSHFIVVAFCKKNLRTVWQRIASDEPDPV